MNDIIIQDLKLESMHFEFVMMFLCESSLSVFF